jgi:hypothetical protein
MGGRFPVILPVLLLILSPFGAGIAKNCLPLFRENDPRKSKEASEIGDPHGVDFEDYYLPGCDVVWLFRCISMLQRYALPPSSG